MSWKLKIHLAFLICCAGVLQCSFVLVWPQCYFIKFTLQRKKSAQQVSVKTGICSSSPVCTAHNCWHVMHVQNESVTAEPLVKYHRGSML